MSDLGPALITAKKEYAARHPTPTHSPTHLPVPPPSSPQTGTTITNASDACDTFTSLECPDEPFSYWNWSASSMSPKWHWLKNILSQAPPSAPKTENPTLTRHPTPLTNEEEVQLGAGSASWWPLFWKGFTSTVDSEDENIFLDEEVDVHVDYIPLDHPTPQPQADKNEDGDALEIRAMEEKIKHDNEVCRQAREEDSSQSNFSSKVQGLFDTVKAKASAVIIAYGFTDDEVKDKDKDDEKDLKDWLETMERNN